MYSRAIVQWYSLSFAAGFMSDTDVPMHIGAVCGVDYFVGYIDDVRTPI